MWEYRIFSLTAQVSPVQGQSICAIILLFIDLAAKLRKLWQRRTASRPEKRGKTPLEKRYGKTDKRAGMCIFEFSMEDFRMENWKNVYSEKLCFADEAVKLVKDGQRVLVGGVAARPEELMRALVRNADSFHGVKVMHGLSSGGEDYLKEEYAENFIHETLFVSASTRKAVNEGRGVVYPCYYFEIGDLLKDRDIEIDAFMFQASLPDEHGYCSCGLNADFIREAIEMADTVIMQINEKMPRNGGIDSLVHVS